MAEIIYNEARGEWEYRQMLRSPYIDYFNGRFFVTFQVYNNKSVFGAIVGEKCALNELGAAVESAWREEPGRVAGLALGEFVVMPNHFHAIVEYHATPRSGGVATGHSGGVATGHSGGVATSLSGGVATCGDRPTEGGRLRATSPARYTRDPHARDLPYVIGLFKSYTTTLYRRLKAAGKCVDIGPRLWQDSFYDELIRNDEQYRNTAHYILNNPRNWNSDRFGAITSFAAGNIGLLQGDYIAYLSSEGRGENDGAKAPANKWRVATCGDCPSEGGRLRTPESGRLPVISTFTSYYERQMLAKCLAGGRRFIWVCPGGISDDALAKTAQARAVGRALLISPIGGAVAGVNKQRANYCNQFIVKNAAEIWVGHIRPGGSLETILKSL